jgi:hypothetical protein
MLRVIYQRPAAAIAEARAGTTITRALMSRAFISCSFRFLNCFVQSD